MTESSNIEITISFADPSLDDEELQAEVQNLLPQILEVDGVEDADLIAVDEAPPGSKAFGGYLLGMLKTMVSEDNIKSLFDFLRFRLGGKPIKLNMKLADGRELKIEASSLAEFELAFQSAQKFYQN